MYVLDKLWRGDIAPFQRFVRPGSEYKRKSAELSDAAKRFAGKLTPEENQHWEAVKQLEDEMARLAEEDLFLYGFRMGARMILDVVGDYKGQFCGTDEVR